MPEPVKTVYMNENYQRPYKTTLNNTTEQINHFQK